MVFPLDIRTDLFLGDHWQDISADVYVREVKQITRGLRDMGSAADPSSLSLTLDNRAGKYSPRNAMSPLFGLLGRNTPIRVSVPSGDDHYLQLNARSGDSASTPHTADLAVTADLDVRAELEPDWYGPNNQLIMGKWDRASGQLGWAIQIYDGLFVFRWSPGGVTEYALERALPQDMPDRAAVRAVFDADNGSGATEIKMYWAESIDGTWTEFARYAFFGGSVIAPTTAPLRLGITDPRDGVARARVPLSGRLYRAEVRTVINGPAIASVDFRAATPGAPTFTGSAGRIWTLSGSAEVRDREDRFIGEVAEWPLRWSVDDADRYAPIAANGILRRLGQGAKALDSTLRRRVPSGNPVAYWPMEEQENAVQAYSPIPGVLPASVSSVDWAAVDTLPSSAPLPKLTGESSLSAIVPPMPAGSWHVEMLYNADDKIPMDLAPFLKVYSPDGTIRRWEVHLKNSSARLYGFDWTNTKVLDRNVGIGADIFHGWNRLRLYAADDGAGNFNYTIAWQDVGGEAGSVTKSFAGTAGSVNLIAADWTPATADWAVGHLAVFRDAGNTTMTGSDNAFLGESAFARMRRLSQEEGLSFTRAPGRLPVAQVGYQRQAALVDLFEAAADGDGGILTEDMRRIGLHYRDRSSMYAQEPRLTLSYTAPGLGPDLEPVDDDSHVENDVTVTRDGGSSARAVLADGPLSVKAAPDGIGKYDASYDLSLGTDDQVSPVAFWRLHLGTWDGARYPSVSLILHKPGAEALIPDVLRLREGDKIRLTNLPQWVSHDDIDLLVMGWTERLDIYRWELELNCIPAGPWDTAITDHTLFGKADTDGTVLETAVSATDTALVVRPVSGPLWADKPEHLPYDIRVSGETMRVTAVTQSGADAFERTVSNGWGTADSGQAWKSTGGAASDRAVNGGRGVITLPSSVSSVRAMTLPMQLADAEVRVRIRAEQVSTGASLVPGVLFRWSSASECYRARVHFGTAGSMFVSITRGTTTLGAQPSLPYTYTAGAEFEVRAQVIGHTVRIRAWPVGQPEPGVWHHTATVTDSPIAVGEVGLSGSGFSGVTNVSPTFRYDNFQITDTQRFTVVRSLNGVTKPQSAGSAVNIAQPAITSL